MSGLLSKILISGLVSFSARCARVQPNPDDYEIIGGLKTVAFTTEVKYERENGSYYRGLKVKTEPVKLGLLSRGLYGEININEAYDISRQFVYNTLIGGRLFRLRTTNNWDNWGGHRLMVGAESELEVGSFRSVLQLDSNFSEMIFRLRASYDLVKDDRRYISPVFVYENYEGKKIWQAKIEYVRLFGAEG